MNSRHLVERFRGCRERNEAIVLVTVFETLGSTYSKAGARMLITAGGESQGLVSGGCLEGDLAARARQVLDANEAEIVTYDLRDEADELFGLGVGCNGLISVLLQPVRKETAYEPMASIADILLGETIGAVASIIDAGSVAVTCGASVALVDGQARTFGVPQDLVSLLEAGCRKAVDDGRASLVTAESGMRVLYVPLVPVPRVLILGAGLDAVPLVNVLAELGWRVSVADHRPAYLERDGFARAEASIAVRPKALEKDVRLENFDAIVVMSHHLVTDREYLRQLAAIDVPYLGLLGPPARRQRLLDELGDQAGALVNRLRGPVGIDIGADTAESIAVSIAAEMQQVLVEASRAGVKVAGSDSRRTA
jgi:xanthine/CO dehydrogenase XdhC/CoxF family maturation factor